MHRAGHLLLGFLICSVALATAQTVVVDITPSHIKNRFVPNQALGAGVDRIPAAAFDVDLVQPNLGAALESGWQPVSYRQNTELAVEAWHWNPRGRLERSGAERLLHRLVRSWRSDPLFVWLCVATPRIYPQ